MWLGAAAPGRRRRPPGCGWPGRHARGDRPRRGRPSSPGTATRSPFPYFVVAAAFAVALAGGALLVTAAIGARRRSYELAAVRPPRGRSADARGRRAPGAAGAHGLRHRRRLPRRPPAAAARPAQPPGHRGLLRGRHAPGGSCALPVVAVLGGRPRRRRPARPPRGPTHRPARPCPTGSGRQRHEHPCSHGPRPRRPRRPVRGGRAHLPDGRHRGRRRAGGRPQRARRADRRPARAPRARASPRC